MRKFYCLSLLLLLLQAASFSQDNIISGKVTGTDRTPLLGVTVSVAGTKTQTTTDANGLYSISVPGNATELVFTFVNTRSVTEKINGRRGTHIRTEYRQRRESLFASIANLSQSLGSCPFLTWLVGSAFT